MKLINNLQPSYDLTYSDVFLVPQKTTAQSRFEVNLGTSDGSGNTIPIIVANMTAVTGKRMAETVARRGGIAVMPQDVRPDVLMSTINAVKKAHTRFDTPITLSAEHTIRDALSLINKRSHGAIIITDEKDHPVGIFTEGDGVDKDIFTPLAAVASRRVISMSSRLSGEKMYQFLQDKHLRIAPVVSGGKLIGIMSAKGALRSEIYKPNVDKKGRLKIAVAVGINGDVTSKVKKVIDLGADILVLDTAHGHQEKMIEAIKKARKANKSIPIVAGNVVTAAATEDLIRAGADIIKVGVGPGAMCTTRMMTGVGRPQFSAVMECAKKARALGKHVWADGGIRYPRDVVLALAAGASNVMFASWFTGTYESTADMQRDKSGRMFKENYGMASRRAVKSRSEGSTAFELAKKELFEEGISTSRMYINEDMPSVEDIIDHIISGVRSACTYEGAQNLEELYQNAVVGIQSAAGFTEGEPQATSW